MQETGFTTLDFFVLIAIGLGVWRGLRAGALSQLVGAVGLVLAFFVGVALMEPAGAAVVASLGVAERTAPAVGFIVVFAGVLAGLAAVSHLARKTLESLRVGFVDKGLGALFGGLRAAVALSVLLLMTGSLALPGSGGLIVGMETRERSVLYEPVRALAPALWEAFRAVAPGWQDGLRERFEGLVGEEG